MLEIQKNNPLHGVKLETLLTELVDHYGWEILAAEMNLNCFKSNPSIKSSLKFLRGTPWAREKVEGFYLYKYKRLPRPDDAQAELPPRDRTIPLDQKPRSPAALAAKERSEKKPIKSAGGNIWKSTQPASKKTDREKPPAVKAGKDIWGSRGKKGDN